MKIRKATERDFTRIMEIYDIARKYMTEHGNPKQWGPNKWPPPEVIQRDIDSGIRESSTSFDIETLDWGLQEMVFTSQSAEGQKN